MANNKYDFIKELLANKKLSPEKRERILDLASKEFSIEGTLEERISKLEKLVVGEISQHTEVVDNTISNEQFEEIFGDSTSHKENLGKDSSPSNTERSTDKLPKIYLNPKHTHDFLEDYNQNAILSTTCHLVDSNSLKRLQEDFELENYSFKNHHSLIIEQFNLLEKKYPYVHKDLKKLIRCYLTGENFYGNKDKTGWAGGIKVNWGIQSLLDWTIQNDGVPPNPDKDIRNEYDVNSFNSFSDFEPKLKLVEFEGVLLKEIRNFNQLVYHFKYLFHIRPDNKLKDIINNNILSKYEDEILISLDKVDNIEYFLDVDKLIQAIEVIFDLIIEIKKNNNLAKPVVDLSFYKKGNNVHFSIHHKNTIFLRQSDEIYRQGGSLSDLVSFQINGMGDFEIEAKLLDGKSYLINYWDYQVYKDRKPRWELIPPVEGVKYLIKMNK